MVRLGSVPEMQVYLFTEHADYRVSYVWWGEEEGIMLRVFIHRFQIT